MAYVVLISLLGGNFAVRFSSSLERDLLWAGKHNVALDSCTYSVISVPSIPRASGI